MCWKHSFLRYDPIRLNECLPKWSTAPREYPSQHYYPSLFSMKLEFMPWALNRLWVLKSTPGCAIAQAPYATLATASVSKGDMPETPRGNIKHTNPPSKCWYRYLLENQFHFFLMQQSDQAQNLFWFCCCLYAPPTTCLVSILNAIQNGVSQIHVPSHPTAPGPLLFTDIVSRIQTTVVLVHWWRGKVRSVINNLRSIIVI